MIHNIFILKFYNFSRKKKKKRHFPCLDVLLERRVTGYGFTYDYSMLIVCS